MMGTYMLLIGSLETVGLLSRNSESCRERATPAACKFDASREILRPKEGLRMTGLNNDDRLSNKGRRVDEPNR